MSESAPIIDSAKRSHTALFVLLARICKKTGCRSNRNIDYPVNRAGQNAVECYSLALLVFVLVTGFFVLILADVLGSQIWSFALALPLSLLLTFFVMHILFFGFAFIYRCLKSIDLFPSSAPKQLPAGFYLFFFTVFAVGIFIAGKPALKLVAAPWLIWALAEFLARLILFTGELNSRLNEESE